MRQGIDRGTVPSIDAFQCAACRWARLTFSVNASVVGGRLHNFNAAPISVFFLYILIRASLMLAHMLKPLPEQASMNVVACSNTIASSACVSPIACSESLAVLATLRALIWCVGPCKGMKDKQIWHNRCMYLHTLHDVDYGTIFHCGSHAELAIWLHLCHKVKEWSKDISGFADNGHDFTTMHLVIVCCTIIVSAS